MLMLAKNMKTFAQTLQLQEYNYFITIGRILIIEFFLIALMSGRRSEDYGEMKIRNFDVSTDNFYDKDKFVFQKYKTAKVYGRVVFDVKKMAPQLNVIIKKWIRVNKTDYLLFSSNGKPLSSSQIAHHNNAIWDGK